MPPGLIFAEDDDVIVWISRERLATALGEDGKLHPAPELIIEVLSPRTVDERRDREAMLKLYSRRGVEEYWIIDWRSRRGELYRRENAEPLSHCDEIVFSGGTYTESDSSR